MKYVGKISSKFFMCNVWAGLTSRGMLAVLWLLMVEFNVIEIC